jgi:lipopolysaccharide/colanic/teichoic acid biosynthesis glycosyltransferase
MAVIAVLIKLSSPGPLLYRQQRMGLDCRPFTLLKFRSMRADAEPPGVFEAAALAAVAAWRFEAPRAADPVTGFPRVRSRLVFTIEDSDD